MLYLEKRIKKIERLLKSMCCSCSSVLPQVAAVKTLDEVRTNDDTLTLDSELFVNVEANSFYKIELMLMHNSHEDSDIQFGFSYPADAVGGYTTGTAATEVDLSVVKVEVGNQTNKVNIIVGYITTISAGVVAIEWAQHTLSILEQTSVLLGSSLILTKLA